MSQEHAAAAALHAAKMAQLNAHLGGHVGLEKITASRAHNLLTPQFDLAKLANTAAFNAVAAANNSLGNLTESVSLLTQNFNDDNNLQQQRSSKNNNSNNNNSSSNNNDENYKFSSFSSKNSHNNHGLNNDSTSGVTMAELDDRSSSSMIRNCEDNDQDENDETERKPLSLMDVDLMESENSDLFLPNLMAAGTTNINRLQKTNNETIVKNNNNNSMLTSSPTEDDDTKGEMNSENGKVQENSKKNFVFTPKIEDRIQST